MSALSAAHGIGSVIYGRMFVTLPVPKADTDLSQHTIIVTGANTGLGFEASKHLLKLGLGTLIMAVRNRDKGDEARKQLLPSKTNPNSLIEIWDLDMDSYASIKSFATRASQLPRLDGVLANAGMMTTKPSLSESIEKTLNVNVVSTFYLYLLLLPKMRASGQATGNLCRFTIPNSALHYIAPLAELDPTKPGMLDRLGDAEKADLAGRYPLSKLLVIYAVRGFAKRGEAANTGCCVINTPNPSFCKSNLANESADSAGFKIFEKLLARSTEEGSRALVDGVLAGQESDGQYLTNCHVQA